MTAVCRLKPKTIHKKSKRKNVRNEEKCFGKQTFTSFQMLTIRWQHLLHRKEYTSDYCYCCYLLFYDPYPLLVVHTWRTHTHRTCMGNSKTPFLVTGLIWHQCNKIPKRRETMEGRDHIRCPSLVFCYIIYSESCLVFYLFMTICCLFPFQHKQALLLTIFQTNFTVFFVNFWLFVSHILSSKYREETAPVACHLSSDRKWNAKHLS